MPTTVPALEGLVPIWDFAITAGINEKELIKSLRADGVQLLEISVSGKRAAFADRGDLAAYIARNAAQADTKEPAPSLTRQLESQAQELEQLRLKVDRLLAQATGGATA